MTDTKTLKNFLLRKGFSIDGNDFIVDSKGVPIVVCMKCGKIYNDRHTRVSRTGAHCPYCGAKETAELTSEDIDWFASTISEGSSDLGRLD